MELDGGGEGLDLKVLLLPLLLLLTGVIRAEATARARAAQQSRRGEERRGEERRGEARRVCRLIRIGKSGNQRSQRAVEGVVH